MAGLRPVALFPAATTKGTPPSSEAAARASFCACEKEPPRDMLATQRPPSQSWHGDLHRKNTAGRAGCIAQNLKIKLRSFLSLETGLRRVPRRVWGRPARGRAQTLHGTLRRSVSSLKKDLNFIFKFGAMLNN